jgi:hypothetical protein
MFKNPKKEDKPKIDAQAFVKAGEAMAEKIARFCRKFYRLDKGDEASEENGKRVVVGLCRAFTQAAYAYECSPQCLLAMTIHYLQEAYGEEVAIATHDYEGGSDSKPKGQHIGFLN